MRYLFTLFFVFSLQLVFAQLAISNVYLFDFVRNGENDFSIGNARLVSSDNLNGYNNQPAFFGSLLFISSQRNAKANDIYAYNFAEKLVIQVTGTMDKSEFSPTIKPGGQYFTSVCIEDDGTQRLWQYPLNMEGKPELVMDQIDKIGYHKWIDEQRLVAFLIGEPTTLQIVDVKNQKLKLVALNPGRSFHVHNNELYYIDKTESKKWSIKRYDFENFDVTTLAPTLSKKEDFVVLNDGSLLMASNSKIYKYRPYTDTDWIEVADFADLSLNNISRMTVKGNKLVLVNSPKQ